MVFEGITVIALEQAVAAPLCTRRLAQKGAEVIKIERETGDFARHYDSAIKGQSAYFVWLNGGKKSVVLNLEDEQHKATLASLVESADILVQNLKPGTLSKLGFDLNDWHGNNPRLISCSISGFAPDGPGFSRKAYDLLIQAESGLASITGSPDEPGRVGVSVVDIASGMFAYEAILEALIRRFSTGLGEKLDVSLFDSVAELLTVPYLLDRYGEAAPRRIGLAHPGIAPYGVFHCKDSKKILIGVQNEREWKKLAMGVLEMPEVASDTRFVSNELRVTNRDLLNKIIEEKFSALSFTEISRALDDADIAFAPVNELSGLRDHPDLHLSRVRVGEDVVDLPRVPGSQGYNESAQEVPSLGQHTREILDRIDS